eukprot:357803-Chlamydomonas_euryale.AAC.1
MSCSQPSRQPPPAALGPTRAECSCCWQTRCSCHAHAKSSLPPATQQATAAPPRATAAAQTLRRRRRCCTKRLRARQARSPAAPRRCASRCGRRRGLPARRERWRQRSIGLWCICGGSGGTLFLFQHSFRIVADL